MELYTCSAQYIGAWKSCIQVCSSHDKYQVCLGCAWIVQVLLQAGLLIMHYATWCVCFELHIAWGSLWNWEILPLSAYQCPYVDCLSSKVGMKSVSFLQWYRVPARMGCFPGRTLLVGASVMGKAAMMATHEPYSSGVIITTGWYSAQSNTVMKPDTGLTELSFTWLFTLVALCFPIEWSVETKKFLLVSWCFSWVCYKGALLEWQLWYIAAIWAVFVAKQDLLGKQTWPYWCLVLSTAFLQRGSMILMERADGKMSHTSTFAP